MCVKAENKWKTIFSHCKEALSLVGKESDCESAWNRTAVILSRAKNGLTYVPFTRTKGSFRLDETTHFDIIEKIPNVSAERITYQHYQQIEAYLQKVQLVKCVNHRVSTAYFTFFRRYY